MWYEFSLLFPKRAYLRVSLNTKVSIFPCFFCIAFFKMENKAN